MRKHILILGLILAVIGGYVFWTNHHEQNTPPVASSPASDLQQDNATTPRENAAPSQENMEQENTESSGGPQDIKSAMGRIYSEEQLASEKMQKLFAIFDSPEYAAFLETEQTGHLGAFFDFLASQGIPVDKNDLLEIFQGIFQQHFPGETPESVEPQMRQTLTNLIDENKTDLIGVLTDFMSNEQYNAWGMLHFQTDADAFALWAVGTIKDYLESPPPEALPVVETEVPAASVEDVSADEHSFGELPTDPTELPPVHSTDPSAFEDEDVLTERDINIDADIEAKLRALLEQTAPGAPELPTEASLEKMLRNTFSPQRFNTIMQTLQRYGPEEGLRRIKTSDPEVATQIERFILGNRKEND